MPSVLCYISMRELKMIKIKDDEDVNMRLVAQRDDPDFGLSVLDHYVLALLPGFVAKGGGISENSVAYIIRKAKLLAVRTEEAKWADFVPYVDPEEDSGVGV